MAIKHVRIDDEQYESLQRVKKAFGVPIAEQVRRAIEDYLMDYSRDTDRQTAVNEVDSE